MCGEREREDLYSQESGKNVAVKQEYILTKGKFDPHDTRLVHVGLLDDTGVSVLVIHASQTQQKMFAVLLQTNFAVISADVFVGEASTGGRGFLDHVPQAKELKKNGVLCFIFNDQKLLL